ncbi:MAG: hypothetical protein ACKO14_05160 [Armatimonadota bacterium]
MENGPEMTSLKPSTESPADEVVVEDVTVTDSAASDIDAGCAIEGSSADDVSTEVVTDDVASHAITADTDEASEQPLIAATPDVQEAPAPQAVALFDLGDELAVRPTAPAFDMTEENIEPTVSDDISDETAVEATNDVVDTNVARAEDTVESTISIQDPSPVDDEIFEQVMGSSRAEDIPLARRSTPGSIPLPPQLAEEQARRNRNASPAPVDTRGRRHPLQETGRTSRRPAAPTAAAATLPQPTATPAVEVICPKCQRTTSTRFTFCMKCGTDFPAGYVASLTGHHPQPSTPGGRGGVRDTRTTVRQINRIHESRGSARSNETNGTHQTVTSEPYASFYPASGLAGNPFLVAFLSFLMPGLGHMLIGEHKKGLPWLFAGIAAMAFLPSWSFTIWIPLFLRVFSAINAYQLAIIKQDEQAGPFDTDDDA